MTLAKIGALSTQALEEGVPEPTFPADLPSGRGRSHGTSTNVPFDRWFRYPAGFASDYATVLLKTLSLPEGSLIVDPFAGSGVIGTGCRSMGLAFFGIEAHPLIAELANLKLAPAPGDSQSLRSEAVNLVDSIRNSKDRPSALMRKLHNRETELVLRSFETPVLLDLVRVRDRLKNGEARTWEPYLRWALLATLRDVASVKVGWPYQRPGRGRKPKYADPLARFLTRVQWMSEDLDSACHQPVTQSQVVAGDSRNPTAWKAANGKAHGCISSPPYLNNFDYADATRLELYFWGYASTWAEMCDVVRSDMVTATTQQSSMLAASRASQQLLELGDFSRTLEPLVDRLTSERAARKRGKEYDQVLPDYFAAMAAILRNLAAALEPGSPCVWLIGDSAPYGVYIDTPALIGDLAERVGFTVEKDHTLRRRGRRWANNSSRHNIELSERSIIFRRVA